MFPLTAMTQVVKGLQDWIWQLGKNQTPCESIIWWRLSDIKVQLEVEKKIIDWNIRTERLNSYIRMKSYG